MKPFKICFKTLLGHIDTVIFRENQFILRYGFTEHTYTFPLEDVVHYLFSDIADEFKDVYLMYKDITPEEYSRKLDSDSQLKKWTAQFVQTLPYWMHKQGLDENKYRL